MITWTVTFDENSFASAGVSLEATNLNQSQNGAKLKDLLTSVVRQAGEEWSRHLKDPSQGSTNIVVQIVSDPSTGLFNRPTEGRTSVASDTPPNTDSTSKVNKNYPVPQLYESHAAHKIITGNDSNGNSPDLVINLNPNFLKKNLWFNSATLPPDTKGENAQVDAVSVFSHEIGHALAFNGFRNPVSLPLIGTGLNFASLLVIPYESPFDDNVVLGIGSAFFDGPNVRLVYGDRAPLFYHFGNSQNIYHLAGDSAPILKDDLLNGSEFHPSMRYEVSALDLAILADCGFTLNGPLNLIRNGSFEAGRNPGTYLPLQPNSTAVTGWTVVRGGIDYVGTDWVSSDGNRSLDLNGTPGVGGIAQTFNTIPGQKYRVSFDLAGHYSGLLQTLKVSAAGKFEEFPFQAKTDPKNLEWERKTWDFTANAAQTTLEFDSLQTGYQFGGPALDNVRVEIAPTVPVSNVSGPTSTVANSTNTATSSPGFVTLGGVQGGTTLALPPLASASDRPEFIGGSSGIPSFGGADSYTPAGNWAKLASTSPTQSGSGVSDFLPSILGGKIGSTTLLTGAITPDLVATALSAAPILGQTDTWNNALHLPG